MNEQLLIAAGIWGCSLSIVIGSVAFMAFLLLVRKANKIDIKGASKDSFWVEHFEHFDNSVGAGGVILLGVSAIFAIVGLVEAALSAIELLEILLIPDVWLLSVTNCIAK